MVDDKLAQALEKSLVIALKAHSGQRRKNGLPYIFHPLRLMAKMETPQEMMVAILHDVIEDSDHTAEDLRQAEIPEEVIAAVELLTKEKGADYDEYIGRIKENPLARKAKIADLNDNMNVAELREFSEKDMNRCQKYIRSLAKLEGRS